MKTPTTLTLFALLLLCSKIAANEANAVNLNNNVRGIHLLVVIKFLRSYLLKDCCEHKTFIISDNLEEGASGQIVLPLFGNDTARQLFIGFTPFFRQIGQFLNFRNEIYKT